MDKMATQTQDPQQSAIPTKQKNWTDQGIKALTGPKVYGIEKCLYLRVPKTGPRYWIFRWRDRYKTNAKGLRVLRDMGLASYGKADDQLTLAAARTEAAKNRAIVKAGKDPIDVRDKAFKANAPDKVPTFAECTAAYIKRESPGWKNAKHKSQWESTLKTYCDSINGKAVNLIDDHHITDVLEPHWLTRHETMRRLRGRIEAVLDWATVKKYRKGLNPARLKGHQDKLLPKVPKATKKKRHHAALAYSQMHPLMKELRGVKGASARALEFLILTAARTGEVITMEWSEVDLTGAVWIVPADKMKMEREHRVPLSDGAVKILKAQQGQHDKWVFPGIRQGKRLSTHAMLMLLRDRRPGITVHGFRSSFRTWAAEKTNVDREVCEAALAHANDDDVEDAYKDTDYLAKRIPLMDRWAKYCATKQTPGKVTQLKTA